MNLKDIMTLRKAIARRSGAVFSVKLALKVLKFKKETETEAEFYTERHLRILRACARTDEDGNFVKTEDGCILLKPDRAEEYRSQMQELDETESDAYIEFTPEDLSEMKLTLGEMENVIKYVKE